MDIPILTAEEGAVLLHAKNRELKAEIERLRTVLGAIATRNIGSIVRPGETPAEADLKTMMNLAREALTAAK